MSLKLFPDLLEANGMTENRRPGLSLHSVPAIAHSLDQAGLTEPALSTYRTVSPDQRERRRIRSSGG